MATNFTGIQLFDQLLQDGIISDPEHYWPIHLTYSGIRLPKYLDAQQFELCVYLFNKFHEQKYSGYTFASNAHNMFVLATSGAFFGLGGVPQHEIRMCGLVTRKMLSPNELACIRRFMGFNEPPEILARDRVSVCLDLATKFGHEDCRVAKDSRYYCQDIIAAYEMCSSSRCVCLIMSPWSSMGIPKSSSV